MPAGSVILALTERVCLEYLAGNAARGDQRLRIAGLEIVIAALGKVLVPMVCAFGKDEGLDQYRELSNSEALRAAREALGDAELLSTPRFELSAIRDRAIAVAIDQGLSEPRARDLVGRALEAIQLQLAPAPVRR